MFSEFQFLIINEEITRRKKKVEFYKTKELTLFVSSRLESLKSEIIALEKLAIIIKGGAL